MAPDRKGTKTMPASNKTFKAINFTSKQLRGTSGAWYLRIMVGGRRIKRKLDDPRLTTKKLAEARARERHRDAPIRFVSRSKRDY